MAGMNEGFCNVYTLTLIMAAPVMLSTTNYYHDT